MKEETIYTLDAFRIALGVVFSLCAGYVLDNDMILAFLLVLIGIGFLSFRIDATKNEAFEE